MAKKPIKCEVCGAEFKGGRALGSHRAQNPDCRPAGWTAPGDKPKGKAKGKGKGKRGRPAGTATASAAEKKLTAHQHITAALRELDKEIGGIERELAAMGQRQKELDDKKKQRAALAALLPKV